MNSILFLILGTVISTNVAHADVPRKYSNCPAAQKITVPSSSNGHYFSEECNTAYVLPPDLGEIRVAQYYQELNNQTCKVLMSNINAIELRLNEIKTSEAEALKVSELLRSKDAQIARVRKICEPVVSADAQLKATISSLEASIARISAAIATEQANKQECVLRSQRESQCTIHERNIKSYEKQIAAASKNKKDLELRWIDVTAKKSACESEVSSRTLALESERDQMRNRQEELAEERAKFADEIKTELEDLTAQSGGTVSISFLSGQMDMVRKYKDANPNLGVVFAPIPIQNGVISFEMVRDGKNWGLPAVLRSNILGLKVVGTDLMTTPTDILQPSGSLENNVFGQAVSGQVVVNRLAACQLAQEYPRSDDRFKAEKLGGFLFPSVKFNYQVQTDRRIRVKYEETHLYQMIKKHSKSRGFFSNKTAESLTKKSEAEKWIQIEFMSQDGDNAFVDVEKMAMDIRQEYLDAALMKVAKGYLNEDQARLVEPDPEDGATRAGNRLREGCKNIYCQYTALALNLSSDLFGGATRAEASMKEYVSAKAGEEILDKKMVVEMGGQSFQVKKEVANP